MLQARPAGPRAPAGCQLARSQTSTWPGSWNRVLARMLDAARPGRRRALKPRKGRPRPTAPAITARLQRQRAARRSLAAGWPPPRSPRRRRRAPGAAWASGGSSCSPAPAGRGTRPPRPAIRSRARWRTSQQAAILARQPARKAARATIAGRGPGQPRSPPRPSARSARGLPSQAGWSGQELAASDDPCGGHRGQMTSQMTSQTTSATRYNRPHYPYSLIRPLANRQPCSALISPPTIG